MKNVLLIISFFCFSFTTLNSDSLDKLGVKGPLEFGKTMFKLAWSDQPRPNYYIQEYLPEGESLEKFNQMISIHLFATDIKLKVAVKLKIEELTKRKKTDGVCNFIVTESPDGKENIVDFLLGESKGDAMTIVEFNVYRYKQVDLGNNRTGIMVYAFSKRSYGDEITQFFNTLKEDRVKYLNQMIGAKLPTVAVSEKQVLK